MKSSSNRPAEGFPRQRLTVVPSTVLRRARKLDLVKRLLVTHIGAFSPAPRHYVSRKRGASQYILIVCLAGAGRASIGSRSWRLGSGDAIILPPHTPHSYQARIDDPWSIFWVHFCGPDATKYVETIGASGKSPCFNLQHPRKIGDAFEESYRHVLGGFTDADLFGLTTSFARLLGLCRLYQRSPNLKRRQSEDRVLATVRYMEKHYASPITLDSLAKVAHWSPPHFSTQFRRQMNSSPIEFLTQLRLRHAADLLKFSDLGIQQIADAVGYADPFYFSRRFQSHMNLSPSQYRERFSPREA